MCEFLDEPGTQLYWDRAAGLVPYAVLNDTWLSYDNQISLQKKVPLLNHRPQSRIRSKAETYLLPPFGPEG